MVSALHRLDTEDIADMRRFVRALERAGVWSRNDLAALAGLDRKRFDAVLAARGAPDEPAQQAIAASLVRIQDYFRSPAGRAAFRRLEETLEARRRAG